MIYLYQLQPPQKSHVQAWAGVWPGMTAASCLQKYLLKTTFGRPAIKVVDRQSNWPAGHHIWSMATKHSRWPQAMAGGMRGCPKSHSLPSKAKTQVFGAKPDTKQSSSEILRQGARAETSGNSKRTQTWMITECSNGDVQVLRTVKNGVSTVAPL